MDRIPKIIHQTWEDHNIPKEMRNYVKSWKEKNPDYQLMFWTADDRRNLIKNYYPEFLKYFDSYPHQIMRVDAFKLFVLHRYGGFYADLDLECYKNLDPLLAESDLLLFLEWPGSVSNAAMGSKPGHPFLEYCFKRLIDKHVTSGDRTMVWKVTGPRFVTRTLQEYKRQNRDKNYKVYPSYYFFPIPWHKPSADQSGQAHKYPKSYGAHHWQGTWWQDQPSTTKIFHILVTVIVYTILAIILGYIIAQLL